MAFIIFNFIKFTLDTVKYVCNCQLYNTAVIIKRGSMNVKLHKLALRIFAITAGSNIKLRMIWVPRSEVERADINFLV